MRLGELISEFFEITRFNLQDIVLEKENIDIGMMLEQLADESYAVLANKSLTCTVNTKDNLIVNGIRTSWRGCLTTFSGMPSPTAIRARI